MQYDSLTNHVCRTEEEKITAYNIRYQAYTTVGYNPVCTRGLFTDKYDEKPNNISFLLKDNGKPFATVRASILHRPLGWVDIPCKGGFESEFAELEKEYDTIIEMGRLAVIPEKRGLESVAPLALFSNIYMIDERFGRTAIVCGSSKKHKRFYERLGMKSLCGFAPRPNTAIDLTLMAKDLDLDEFISRGYLDEYTIRRLIPTFPDDVIKKISQPEQLVVEV
ncbi:hypothetical protein [uncultured Photobacterium sp.]|uniref:N-acyl amino acid synthase FeeM domain-containing protein n=1 Tax=uncultured Photobacterium sp. TaxID=173973 RepID=UPI00261A7E87|nr:hypothetical protein [uncultured Photobacterium sp.]